MPGHEAVGGKEAPEARIARLRSMTLDEVGGYLDSLFSSLLEISTRYAGTIESSPRTTGDEDLAALMEAICDLIPLGLNDEVQHQILEADTDNEVDISGLAFSRIGFLGYEITQFLATFDNAPVVRGPGAMLD